MKNIRHSIWLLFIFLFFPGQILAKDQGFGEIAANLFGSEMNIKSIVQTICIITGSGLILGGLIQYRRHRKNPIEVPLSTPILSWLAGLALLLLSLIPLQN